MTRSIDPVAALLYLIADTSENHPKKDGKAK
jgi:hypothetical protein